ncbi:MAG: C10 family peptidase [Rikenellaceae bacterium]
MRKILHVWLVALIVLTSCQKVEQFSEQAPVQEKSMLQNSVERIPFGLESLTASDAQTVAVLFSEKQFKVQKTPMVSTATRSGSEQEVITNESGEIIAYVVNYEDGGFCLVSATTQLNPILAYNDTGAFDVSVIDNSGLSIWVSDLCTAYENTELLSDEEQFAISQEWMEYQEALGIVDDVIVSNTSDYSDPDMYAAFNEKMGQYGAESGYSAYPLSQATNALPSYTLSLFKSAATYYGCPEQYAIVVIEPTYEYKEVGPLVTTNWYQRGIYNDCVPDEDPAGCVAIAMTQIMNYHRYPNYFDWDAIAEEGIECSQFVYDVGVAAETKYGANGSSSTINKASDALNNYGYTTEIYEDSDLSVKNEIINYKRPVYLRGQSSGFIFLDDGHAWLCSGATSYDETKIYKLYTIKKTSSNDYYYSDQNDSYSDYYYNKTTYHHNWGWGLYSGNGWYEDLYPVNDSTGDYYVHNTKAMQIIRPEDNIEDDNNDIDDDDGIVDFIPIDSLPVIVIPPSIYNVN